MVGVPAPVSRAVNAFELIDAVGLRVVNVGCMFRSVVFPVFNVIPTEASAPLRIGETDAKGEIVIIHDIVYPVE